MKVFLRTSGGIGGIQMQGQLDTTDLPNEVCEQVEEALQPEKLHNMDTTSDAGFPDTIQYELRVWTGDDELESYMIEESTAPPELLEVLDVLVNEMNRQKAQGA